MKTMKKKLPGPVSLEERRVIDDGWQQSRERPEKQSREELSDDGILERESESGSAHTDKF